MDANSTHTKTLDCCHIFYVMADYNAWMNQKIYWAVRKLTPEQLAQDRGAFFGSILGTLNHLVVGDIIWLKRFATYPTFTQGLAPIADYPQPQALNQLLYPDLDTLQHQRLQLDQLISHWITQITEKSLADELCYTNSKGIRHCKTLGHLILHFFNHQTHHRGQISTLLHQAGQDIGTTDLVFRLPETP
ncbi:MAG: DinB family protein [Pseudomonadota bacterium]|nr:DinB family protein [Pseudomonadota bacterium]